MRKTIKFLFEKRDMICDVIVSETLTHTYYINQRMGGSQGQDVSSPIQKSNYIILARQQLVEKNWCSSLKQPSKKMIYTTIQYFWLFTIFITSKLSKILFFN